MDTLSQPARKSKVSRSVSLLLPIGEQSPGVVRITVGKATVDYFLSPVAADFGRGFLLEKVLPEEGEPEAYHLNLDAERSTCECRGHLRHGHCKHVDGLAALITQGKI